MIKITALVPLEYGSINLANLYRYNLLWGEVVKHRYRYKKLHDQVITICNEYFSKFESITESIKQLRIEIRINTRGTPSEGFDYPDLNNYIHNGTEQLYNANMHLLKTAYRMLAPLTHPDKGGDVALFQQVKTAYELRDLTFLQELYIKLKKDSISWRCSREAVLYCEQELERVKVSQSILINSQEFMICREHGAGRYENAAELAKTKLLILRANLQQELSNLYVCK